MLSNAGTINSEESARVILEGGQVVGSLLACWIPEGTEGNPAQELRVDPVTPTPKIEPVAPVMPTISRRGEDTAVSMIWKYSVSEVSRSRGRARLVAHDFRQEKC